MNLLLAKTFYTVHNYYFNQENAHFMEISLYLPQFIKAGFH